MKYLEREKLKVITYSKIGQNHIDTGLENQDTILAEALSDDCGFLALADGVSSAPNAKEGSQAAVEVIQEVCRGFYNGNVLENLDDLKVGIVRNWKSKFSASWNDYATTLNFLIYKEDFLLVGQIGDGLIVVDIGDDTKIFTEDSDFYSTETEALGEAVRKSAFHIEKYKISDGFKAYMTSDGIGKEIAEESRTNLCNYLMNMLENSASAIEEELNPWIEGLSKKNGDDKSIGFIRMEK